MSGGGLFYEREMELSEGDQSGNLYNGIHQRLINKFRSSARSEQFFQYIQLHIRKFFLPAAQSCHAFPDHCRRIRHGADDPFILSQFQFQFFDGF
mgnify:CR=1 FL=1